MTESNRRRHPRVPLNMVVQFRHRDMAELLEQHAVNISMSGMFVGTDEPHPEGSVIYFQFTLDEGDPLIEGLGKVVRSVKPTDDAPGGMGIEFVNLDDQSMDFVTRIVRRRMNKKDEI